MSATPITTKYKYLVSRPDKWKKQFYVRDRGSLTARDVYGVMVTMEWSPEQVAEDYNLPVEVVLECIEYCQENWDLISAEVREERIRGGLDPYEDKPLSTER